MSGRVVLGLCAPLALLGACQTDPSGPWTTARVLAPALARVDADGDGTVTQAEYDAVSLGTPSFAEADADHDGVLSLTELRTLTMNQDPLDYAAAAKAAGEGAFATYPGAYRPGATNDQHGTGGPPNETWFVLRTLREEILSVNPAAVVPDDAMLSYAGRTDSLASPESRWVLGQLEQQATALGLDFPASLRASAAVPGAGAPPGDAAAGSPTPGSPTPGAPAAGTLPE